MERNPNPAAEEYWPLDGVVPEVIADYFKKNLPPPLAQDNFLQAKAAAAPR